MNFGHAIEAMKLGMFVARKVWDDARIHIVSQPLQRPFIEMMEGGRVATWIVSQMQMDVLSDDWQITEGEEPKKRFALEDLLRGGRGGDVLFSCEFGPKHAAQREAACEAACCDKGQAMISTPSDELPDRVAIMDRLFDHVDEHKSPMKAAEEVKAALAYLLAEE